MKASRRSWIMPRLRLLFVLSLSVSLALGRAEERAEKSEKVDSRQEAARRFGQKLLGTGSGPLGFDGPIRIEKDDNGVVKAVFCVRNSGLEPKAATVFAGSARSQVGVGVIDPGERKCSSIDVSEIGGDPAGQLRIEEHGPW